MSTSQIHTSPLSQEITRKSGSNFRLAMWFLTKEKRSALEAIYAFARRADDAVDDTDDPLIQQQALNHLKEQLRLCFEGTPTDGPMKELSHWIQSYHLSRIHFEELLLGCEMDIEKKSYGTFEELRVYCYRVASSLGLLLRELFGCTHEDSKKYIIHTGIALQLTNIIRDVGEDVKIGRCYVPNDELMRFNYTIEDLQNNRYGKNFNDLMNHQATRASSYYIKGLKILPEEDRRKLLVARIMAGGYHEMLQKIVQNKYQVFNQKIRISKIQRIWIALKLFFGYKENFTPLSNSSQESQP